MSTRDRTPPGQAQTLRFELDLPHPPAKVWRALTDPELLAQWLLPAVGYEARPDVEFTFQAPPQPGWNGMVHCRILAADEPTLLCYAWTVSELDTVVTFALAPSDSGTRLTITHDGFKPGQGQNFAGAKYGWKLMAGRLTSLLETSQP